MLLSVVLYAEQIAPRGMQHNLRLRPELALSCIHVPFRSAATRRFRSIPKVHLIGEVAADVVDTAS
jgi:hypothetical protein